MNIKGFLSVISSISIGILLSLPVSASIYHNTNMEGIYDSVNGPYYRYLSITSNNIHLNNVWNAEYSTYIRANASNGYMSGSYFRTTFTGFVMTNAANTSSTVNNQLSFVEGSLGVHNVSKKQYIIGVSPDTYLQNK